MLKNLSKHPIFKINKTSIQFNALQKFKFSGGGHSDSDHDHSHSEHSDNETKDPNFNEWTKFENEERNRIFARKNDEFSVEEMLNKANTPLKTMQKGNNPVDLFKTEQEYIAFLFVKAHPVKM